jgi:hypothetical protein
VTGTHWNIEKQDTCIDAFRDNQESANIEMLLDLGIVSTPEVHPSTKILSGRERLVDFSKSSMVKHFSEIEDRLIMGHEFSN